MCMLEPPIDINFVGEMDQLCMWGLEVGWGGGIVLCESPVRGGCKGLMPTSQKRGLSVTRQGKN